MCMGGPGVAGKAKKLGANENSKPLGRNAALGGGQKNGQTIGSSLGGYISASAPKGRNTGVTNPTNNKPRFNPRDFYDLR